MNGIFKLFIICIVSFNSFLYADGTDVSVTVTDASSVYENNGPLKFTIQLSEAPLFGMVTVNYTTTNGTAKAGEDYNTTIGSVTFYPLQSSKTIEVPIINDNIHEDKEYLYFDISTSTTGYKVTDNRGIGYIYDDDTAPIKATLYNRYEAEGDTNWTLNFTVGLNQKAPKDITLNYTTIDNTAINNSDYIKSSGTLTIPKGKKYGYIPVTIIGDTIPEGNEYFSVKINSISEGTILRDTSKGTIIDDDAIKIYMDSQDINEGDTNDNNKMAFKIYLKKEYPLNNPLTIHYETADGSSTPSATSGSDYISKSGDITFNKGDKEKTIYVDIIGDKKIEDDEFLQMNLSGSGYIITTKSQALILNDDGDYPSLSLSSTEYSTIEGNSSQKNLDFNFTLDKPALEGSSFHYETYDNTAQNENGDNDYIYTHGDKILNAGTKKFSISVPINGDTKIEEDENFYFTFTNLKKLNSGSTDSAKGIILNDDGSYPNLSFIKHNFYINEGNDTQQDMNFTLVLDKPAMEGSHFDYYTTDNTAINPEDYQKIKRTTFHIPVGEQNITIPVQINGDTKIENDESFYLIIVNESKNLKISGTRRAKGIIVNDDGSFPIINIEKKNYSVIEGNSSSTILQIKFILNKPALKDSSIGYYTYDLEAQDGSTTTKDMDYIGTKGTTINIPKGSKEVSINLTINGDTDIEPDERFMLVLNHNKNLTIGRGNSIITIINDDIHNEKPFQCDSHMYLSSSIKRGSEITGKMWLHRIDTHYSPFRFEVMDDAGENKLYNALAYSEKDNYIYGLYHRELFKLSQTAKVMSLGVVSRLPDFMDKKQAYAGASFNGYYYVTGFGVPYDKMYKIKLSDNDDERKVQEINLTIPVSIKDFSFSPDGKYLYGIADRGKLTKIDVKTGDVTFIGKAHTGYEFDSSFSDKNGRFFANDRKGNGFFEFNLKDGTKRFLSDSQPADFNDGANCIKAQLIFTDYGDAPANYGKAWHNIANNIYLGDKVDHDIKSYSNITATGDDTNGTDDEDGITLLDGTPLENKFLENNSTQKLKVKISKDAYLRIWIDLDIDGHFDNKHDLVYDHKLTAGEHIINISLPKKLKQNTTTYLRARISSTPNMNYKGYISDGEVEDYAIKFGSANKSLRGTFNIERTDSENYPINTHKRNAWFTQIVGRDFDYSLVFYKEDLSSEQKLNNVTIKIELLNEETNKILYQKYAYIKNSTPKSRIDNLLPNDLNSLPATKKARFRIYYGVNNDGSIIQAPCDNDPKICFESLPKIAYVDAKDDFAIRPEYFHIIVSDENQTLRVNTSPDNTQPLRLTAGYNYNLSITASSYNGNDNNPSKDYNASTTRIIEFLDKNNSSAIVKSDFNSTDDFIDGKSIPKPLKIQEVGRYRLGFIDNDWTKVDSDKGDCDINSSATSENGNIKSGCSTASKPDINVTFYPHHFDIDFAIENLPNSSHNDFIYMSEINSTFNNVAIDYQGKITPRSKDNKTTKNFVSGYMAQNTLLNLKVITLSDNGINKPIKTTQGTPVKFTRVVKFNNENNSIVESNQTFADIPAINITKEKFKDENNATVKIDIRFNINKNLSETINPIKITFREIDVNSTDSYSLSNGSDENNPFIPKGYQNLGDKIRNFYFARVAPDKYRFPKIYFGKTDSLRTPMQIEIFCGKNVNMRYCKDTNLIKHTKLESSPRAELGWYISIDHNASVDGNVNLLKVYDPNPNALQFSTTSIPTFPIKFEKGRNGTITTRFTDPTGDKKYRVDIYAEPQLKFYNEKTPKPPTLKGIPDFIVEGTENNESTWTGIGKTGRILELKANKDSSHKLDW